MLTVTWFKNKSMKGCSQAVHKDESKNRQWISEKECSTSLVIKGV